MTPSISQHSKQGTGRESLHLTLHYSTDYGSFHTGFVPVVSVWFQSHLILSNPGVFAVILPHYKST